MAYDEHLMLVEVQLQKGGRPALCMPHPHHQVDYVVKGSVLFELEGETLYHGGRGDSVVIPPKRRAWGATALEGQCNSRHLFADAGRFSLTHWKISP